MRCDNCGLAYLNPRPAAASMPAFYEDSGYQPFVSTQSRLNLLDKFYCYVREHALSHKRRLIQKYQSPGHLLDIGCGTGEFLHEMQQHNWRVEGVEKDAAAAEFAHKAYQLKVLTENFNEINYLKKSFDVITLWHVLEHLYDPVATLRHAKEILRDDGIILVAVPDIASFDARFYQNYWVALDAPRHLTHFEPHSFLRLCGRVGLKIVKYQQLILDAFFNCLMSEMLINRRTNRKKIFLPASLVRAKAVALVSLIYASRFRVRSKRNGSSILYFIQK